MNRLPTGFVRRSLVAAAWVVAVHWALKGCLWVLSAVPTRMFSADGLILALFPLEEAITAPGRWMQSLVPGEQALGAARWLFAGLNALAWGAAIATLRQLLDRFRRR